MKVLDWCMPSTIILAADMLAERSTSAIPIWVITAQYRMRMAYQAASVPSASLLVPSRCVRF